MQPFCDISFPFRLKDDPKHCGDPRFELACDNNVTFVYLTSHKYYVKAINYGNSSIRLVDASLNNEDICSFPTVSSYSYNFTSYSFPDLVLYKTPINEPYEDIPYPISLISCPNPLKNSSLFTDITTNCASSSGYTYIKVGHINASEAPQTCELDLVVMTSWSGFKDLNNVSLSEIHQSLLYGFELTFCSDCKPYSPSKYSIFFYSIIATLVVIVGLLCAVVSPPVFTICGFAAFSLLGHLITGYIFAMLIYDEDTHFASLPGLILSFIVGVPRIITFPLAVWFLIYKFRRRHFSIFDAIESFLQSDNKLMPIRYSYSDIKKMTRDFQEKLGEGGYGSVYKGKLRSNHDVAVKLLGKSGANGKDFMNEIATIGRIHHVNVVKLVGYCAHGSKRALIFDFMPNGSLEKYLFNKEKMNSLTWDTKFDIAVGIARGIEYLHRGCDIQILHFDIKPHNILLDDKFIPKISDFGLAKFCSTDKTAVTLTAARGTIGYVAPELISRSIGAVSYKADVYSFGMLLVEMIGLKRDLIGDNGNSSKYFPYWIYDCIEQGKDIEIEMSNEKGENDRTRKLVRKMTMVALWCIQMSPDERPPMNKVLQMLEGDVERLRIPESPSQSTQIVMNVDQIETTCFSDSVSLLHHDDLSSSVEITVQE